MLCHLLVQTLKVKFSKCVIKPHCIKACVEVEVWLNAFLKLTLDKCVFVSTSQPLYYREKMTSDRIVYRTGWAPDPVWALWRREEM
jgi:hypothetical protein